MSACNGCGNAFSCMYPDCFAGKIDFERHSQAPVYTTTPDGRDVFEKPARHAADATEGTEAFRLRLTRPDPERRACRVRWALRIALATAGVMVMYCEGRNQPAPGVGFAIALALLGAAALIGGSKR